MAVRFHYPQHLIDTKTDGYIPPPPISDPLAIQNSKVPAILQEPVAIKIYGLDRSTFLSALTEARQIFEEMPTFPHFGEQIPFHPEFFILEPGNQSGKVWGQNSVILRYDPILYKSVEDRPDEQYLGSIAAHLYGMGYDAYWAPTAMVDKSLVFGFRGIMEEGANGSLSNASAEVIRDMVISNLREHGTRLATRDIWSVRCQERIASGFIRCSTRTKAEYIQGLRGVKFSSDHHNNGHGKINLRVTFTPSDGYIPVTSCTTIALWLENTRYTDDEMEDEAMRLVRVAAGKIGVPGLGGANFRRTKDGKFFCFDPDNTVLAMEVCKLPAMNSFFFESAYFLNSDPEGTTRTKALEIRDRRQEAYGMKEPAHDTSTSSPVKRSASYQPRQAI